MLAEEGHSVVWWTSNFDHVRKRHRCEGAQSIEVQPSWRVNMLASPGYRQNISLGRIRHNRSVARAFKGEANRCCTRPDVLFVCLPTPELAERAVEYGWTRNIPVVVDVVDIWPDIYLTAFPPKLRRLARLALLSEFQRASHILRSATSITAVSETYLQWALRYAHRQEQPTDGVFPLGYPWPPLAAEVDIQSMAARLRSDYNIRSDALIATFIGQFGASYDLETVIIAARALKVESNSLVQWVLAGDGDKGTRLRKMAHNLPNVIFTGWLDQISTLALLRLSSVGLAAYTNHALQSLPYKPFEYMSAGLPAYSDAFRPLIPIDSDHLFRFIPAGHSGPFRPRPKGK
jgi:hypothetical protein